MLYRVMYWVLMMVFSLGREPQPPARFVVVD
jgi:hypothetical protein